MTIKDRLNRRLRHDGECWVWTGKLDKYGYGIIVITTAGKRKYRLVHRVAHEEFVGPCPPELDHTCRTRACFNPAHLEGVTHRENIARTERRPDIDTHCLNGHERTPENTYVLRGTRYCRVCAADTQRRYRERLRAAH